MRLQAYADIERRFVAVEYNESGAVFLPSPTELVIPTVTCITRVACGDMHSAIGAWSGCRCSARVRCRVDVMRCA